MFCRRNTVNEPTNKGADMLFQHRELRSEIDKLQREISSLRTERNGLYSERDDLLHQLALAQERVLRLDPEAPECCARCVFYSGHSRDVMAAYCRRENPHDHFTHRDEWCGYFKVKE